MSLAVEKHRNFGTRINVRRWQRGEAAAVVSTVATLALAWLQPFGWCEAAAAINGTLYGAVGPPPFVHPAWMDVGGNATSVGRVDVCALNACEAYVRMRDDLANAVRPINDKLRGEDGGWGGVAGDRGALLEARLQRLDRRLRSVEQPVWTITSGVSRWKRCNYGPCKCRTETHSVSCWRKDFEEIPPGQTLPYDVSAIDLSTNSIVSLHKDTFKGLTNLTELDLTDNDIDYVPTAIFNTLENLTKLRFHRNHLIEVPLLFKRNTKIQILDMSMNHIKQLPETLFQSTKNLVLLHLYGNKIEVFPKSIFKDLNKLEDLDLSANSLLEISSDIFRGVSSLKRLKLQENQLQQLPLGVFDDVEYLEVLSLRNNRISFIRPGLFNNMRRLVYLDLTENWINLLNGNEFTDLVALNELHLGQNYLEFIPERTFKNLASLEKLYLFSNNIQQLDVNSFYGLKNLSSLFLNNNVLKIIDDRLFEPLMNLRKLHIDSNKFQFLPNDCFNHLPKLESLKLSKNPWHCDCTILYLARWLRANRQKVWDSNPTCRGPRDLGGKPVEDMTFEDLCDGQWASMVKLTPRVPIR